jgi:hypothetical protein
LAQRLLFSSQHEIPYESKQNFDKKMAILSAAFCAVLRKKLKTA